MLSRLLESEREAGHAENQRQTALTVANYSFTLLGSRPSPYGGCYRLGVEPRRENKFHYRGEIYVNAADCAVETLDCREGALLLASGMEEADHATTYTSKTVKIVWLQTPLCYDKHCNLAPSVQLSFLTRM